MWWLAFPLLLAASAAIGDGVIWFLANLALPVSIVTAAALVIMWPQCCLIRQAAGWLKTWSRTPGGSTQTPGAVPQSAPGERTGVDAPHHPVAHPPCPQTPAGTDVGSVPQAALSRVCRATTPQAPVDGGHAPVTSSIGLNPGGRGLDSPALAGPPPWLRLAATRRRVCG